MLVNSRKSTDWKRFYVSKSEKIQVYTLDEISVSHPALRLFFSSLTREEYLFIQIGKGEAKIIIESEWNAVNFNPKSQNSSFTQLNLFSRPDWQW